MSQSTDTSLREQLDTAIKENHLQTVKDLYHSASQDKQGDILRDIAEGAAQHANVQLLDWVLNEGFEIPADSLNNEFYHQVCYAHSIPVWQTLVKHGFSLNNHHSEFIGDALSFEAYNGNVDILRFLLENGQDPNDTWGCNDWEPGVCALLGKKPSLEILRLLLQHGWTQKESGTHIAAAELGNMEALQLLVENGADLESTEAWWANPAVIEGSDVWGTALYRAALKGQKESVSYLLQKGASVRFKDKQGRSVLWAARQGGNQAVVKLVKAAGVEE
ncbi:hypothetical protein C2857_000022 [Epichloe festucae Fl1]|uniref:Ankyrin repeat protein n=1 Tax=Epichloe festucae (strain Fl1) TaxID=877507 RepID=A0A7S9KMZ4_EPIFF|nr:hypothetical protein C2857_000022 [Epichloe festucae Fl1]